MKNLLFLLTAVIILACGACVHQKTTEENTFSLNYYFSAETTYQRIEINEKKVSYTFFEDGAGKCAHWLQQSPCWTQTDLKTKTKEIKRVEIDDLVDLLNLMHFMDLNSVYGGAGENQRYYATMISVKLEGKEKTVTYQSFRDATPKPVAFQKIEDKILEFVKNM
ncbi:MAG: hypothetical protein A2Y62_09500 [Candidatus Fischerbacteria bacterium RBG_13_37_8]|uniref:Lipoprotein n=1 Tax=Candidatus Fischerbacteria bacterium RBG_13_37_8 TaxID=1817863 RepID=A0A1F5VJU8_9BACT|nr:MAG: hypothetical protein A2Y62_09500 [Candidatus Fischerbacteria bacterium RBG_13_37_8]